MAHLVTTLALSLLCVSVIHAANYYNRHCLLHNGRCVVACPRHMQPYHTRCDGQTLSQRTCESPIHYVIGYTCGWSRCDCAGGLLWDEQSEYCVKQSECPPYATKAPRRRSGRGERRKNNPRKYRKSKKVEIREEEEPFPSM